MRRIIFEYLLSPFVDIRSGTVTPPYPFGMYDVLGLPSLQQRYDTLLFGRRTYEAITRLAYRCAAESEEGRQFFGEYFGLRKYVFSRAKAHVIGNGMVVRSNIASEVQRIRGESGKDILFCGGMDMLSCLSALNLVDEYLFFIRLAPGIKARSRELTTGFRLADQRVLTSGLTMLRYVAVHQPLKECYD